MQCHLRGGEGEGGGIEREGCNKGDGGTESLLLTKGIGLGSGVLYQSVACKLRRGSRQKRVGWIIVRVSYVFDTMLVHGQQTGYSYVVFWPF